MIVNKSFIFRFDDVEVREREFSLTKAGKVSTVEPKAFRALPATISSIAVRIPQCLDRTAKPQSSAWP
jgi:hypothetical protein